MVDTGTYTIEFQEAERMRQLLAKYPQIAGEELERAMHDSVVLTQQAIQQRTPVFTGALKRSIVWRIEKSIVGGQAADITGIVGSDLVYALPVEIGRRPGSLPPSEPLRRWAAVKLGDADAGEAVRWAIYHRGILPVGMFALGWRRVRGWVGKRFQRALSQIVKRLTSGR